MANEVIEIFGVKSPKNIQNWEEKFDCLYDNDENALYVSKEEFVSEGDPDIKDFHYRYAVECFSMWENEKCQWYYSLQLVVLPEYLDKKYLEGVASCSGIDTDEVNVGDILANGGGSVQFGCEVTEGEELDEDIITSIANVFECMDGLRGFMLDRPWNAVGTNGWNTLKHCLEGEPLFG